jgi:hypothetical protein
MERKINNKITEYFNKMNDDIINIIKQTNVSDHSVAIQNYFNNYTVLQLEKDDFTKRRRIKNVVPYYERCCAYRANGEQCSRRRKGDVTFCGTHVKGQPHGIVTENSLNNVVKTKTISVRQQDIKGIIYYIDDNSNVYDPNDIINGIKNPNIIAKYIVVGDTFTIPAFGI